MKLANMMASAVIAFSAGAPSVIQAQTAEVSETKTQILNGGDFIRVFLTETTADKDGKKTEQTITAVTENNYETILKARAFLDAASPDLKNDIEKTLKEKKIDFDALSAQAKTLQDKLKPQTSEKTETEDGQTPAKTGTDPENPQEPTAAQPVQDTAQTTGQENKPASGDSQPQPAETAPADQTAAGETKDPVTQPAQTPAASETGKAESAAGNTKEPVQSAVDSSEKKTETQKTPAVQDQTEEKQTAGPADGGTAGSAGSDVTGSEKESSGSGTQTETTEPAQVPEAGPAPGQTAVPDGSEDEIRNQTVSEASEPARTVPETESLSESEPAAAAAETAVRPAETTGLAIGGMTMNIPSASTPAAATWNTRSAGADAAESFLSSWLTSAQGHLYAAATSQNQSKILGAIRSWNALTRPQRAAVNDRLVAVSGKTYQQLVREAQQLRMGKPAVAARTRVHTAARSETGFFIGLLTGSLALFLILADRLKNQGRTRA